MTTLARCECGEEWFNPAALDEDWPPTLELDVGLGWCPSCHPDGVDSRVGVTASLVLGWWHRSAVPVAAGGTQSEDTQ